MRLAGAVDIGGTRVKLGIVSDDGRVARRATISTSAGGDPEPLVGNIAAALVPMLESATASGDLAGIGVSVAGFLDAGHGAMYGNANLPRLCGFPLRHELERLLGHECLLEVDSNAAVVAEYRLGAGIGAERLLGVTIGTGLGGGVIVGGRLLRHTGECAGDLGHIILEPGGPPCTCGARGCFEALVCSRALSQRAGGRAVRDIVRDARTGDQVALSAIADTGHWLGLGLASLVPLFAPDTIVVGGGVASAGDLLLQPARASFQAHAGADLRDRARIVGSTLRGWEGMLGAASLVFQPTPA